MPERGDLLEEAIGSRVAKPALCQRAIRRLGIRQLSYHLALGACVRQHIDEVEHDDVQIIVFHLRELREESLAKLRLIDFLVVKRPTLTVTLQQALDHRSFIEVFALLALFVYPQIGEEACDVLWHQPGEDCIAGILCSRRQDREIDRKSTRLNSSHANISYAVFCLKKK